MVYEVKSDSDMKNLGSNIGAILRGGEVIELVGDVGAGKTTLTKGIALGMHVDEDVSSPSFTISRLYDTPGDLQLAHYDFYRLQDPGIMADELCETVSQPHIVTVIEWAEIVTGVLPQDTLRIEITSPTENSRSLLLTANGEKSNSVLEQLS